MLLEKQHVIKFCFTRKAESQQRILLKSTGLFSKEICLEQRGEKLNANKRRSISYNCRFFILSSVLSISKAHCLTLRWEKVDLKQPVLCFLQYPPESLHLFQLPFYLAVQMLHIIIHSLLV